jgi:hypothetical protein
MGNSLVAINTCNRLYEVKKNIVSFIQFCAQTSDFDFVLSLDGTNKDYIAFCEKYKIPLLFSEEREGVGLSKNRVLKQFPDYECYFFIEDDIELIDYSIFKLIQNASKITGIPHFCNNHLKSEVKRERITKLNKTITFSMTGGAQFCFFTKTGIEKVGGWHTAFAKYKRFGHTEHTYRFMYSMQQESPFAFIEGLTESCLIINTPPPVTNIKIETNENELIPEEQVMIDSKQTYFPITTLSKFYFNGFDVSIPHLHPDLLKGRYALLKGKEKIKAWGNFYFHKYKISKNPLYFLLALLLYANNNLLKHYVKTNLISWKVIH